MVLNNLLGITDSAELARVEEQCSKMRALELFESGLLDEIEVGTFKGLADIHRHLFCDVYDFSGKLRTENIAKGNFRFAPVLYLESALSNIEKMPHKTLDQIVEKYVEMNVAHPFREGNGRSVRIWLDCILKHELGCVVNWSLINKTDYLLAMERSPIRDLELKTLIKSALTTETNDRMVFMKGIDASYRYEGYEAFSMLDVH